MDSESDVSAFDAKTGRRLWHVDLTPHGEAAGAIAGGVAYYDGKLFVSTGYGDVLALQPSTGQLFWVAELKLPNRGPPPVAGGRAFVITLDNTLTSLNDDHGDLQWSH